VTSSNSKISTTRISRGLFATAELLVQLTIIVTSLWLLVHWIYEKKNYK